MDVSFAHDANTVTILIGSTVNQAAADESWGIRDFEIFLEDGTIADADDLNMTSGNWWYTAWGGNNFSDTDGWTVTNAYS